MRCHHAEIRRYRKGAEANMKADSVKTFLLPKTSERDAAGKLISIPGMVEAEATNPVQNPSGVSRLAAKGFNTGFLDMVELRIASIPIMQSIRNMLRLAWFELGIVR